MSASAPSSEKRFRADVLGVQVALESLRGAQLPEDVATLLAAEAMPQAPFLELVLQPQPLLGVRHVRELRSDVAPVDVLQLREDVPQLQPPGHRLDAAAGVELGVEVCRGQMVIIKIEHPRPGPRDQRQRVDGGDEVSAALIHTRISRETAACPRCPRAPLPREPGRPAAARCAIAARTGACARSVPWCQAARSTAPKAPLRSRIAKVLLVEGARELAVAAIEGC